MHLNPSQPTTIKMKIYFLVGLFICVGFFAEITPSQAPKKIAYGVLLDNTGTLRPQLGDVKSVGKIIVRQINSQGVATAFSFSTQVIKKQQIAGPIIGIEWSNDLNRFDRYIDSLTTTAGQTALLDAIRFSAETINLKANVEKDNFSEKVLVIITDGEDRISKSKPKELIAFLSENHIKVYAVGLVERLSTDGGYMGPSPQTKSKDFLKKITEETGGRVVFPKPNQTIEDVVRELFAGSSIKSK